MSHQCPDCETTDEHNAYYEAGHAVIGYLCGLEIDKVTISPDADACDWRVVWDPTTAGPDDCGLDWPLDRIIKALIAGPAALMRYSFGAVPPEFDLSNCHIVEDPIIWHAIDLAGPLVGDGTAVMPMLWREVAENLTALEVWVAVDAVAQLLLIGAT
jgi:hypothetical protein